MPEPNERQIEQLLKAAGAKRREQAGAPELHPAAREILHTEVRRQYGPAPDRGKHGGRWLARVFLPRMVVLAVLGVCAWLLMSRNAEQPPMRTALKEKVASSPNLGAEASRSTAPMTAAVEPSASSLRGEEVDRLAPAQSQPVASGAPRADSSAKPARAAPVGEPALAEAKSVVGPEYFKAGRQGMYLGTAAVEPEDQQAAAPDKDVALGALMQSPTGSERRTSEFGDLSASGSLQIPVLQHFTLFNQGDTVRVVDADGSTYEGTIQPVAAVVSGATGGQAVMESPVAFSGSRAKTPTVSGSAKGVTLLNYNLVASGTNRSLGQVLRFKGSLALTGRQLNEGRNVFSNTIPGAAGKAPGIAPAGFTPFANGRLEGTAVLSDGQDVPVDAVPTIR